MAMMMARLYTGHHDLVCLRNAYHGLSGGWREEASVTAGWEPWARGWREEGGIFGGSWRVCNVLACACAPS